MKNPIDYAADVINSVIKRQEWQGNIGNREIYAIHTALSPFPNFLVISKFDVIISVGFTGKSWWCAHHGKRSCKTY